MDATTKITKNLGGDRLGSGSKNNISMHAYNRSTHDLSYAWRSSMNVGTLVPFLKRVTLPGDTWSIDLETLVRTIPSVGPMYGSYKLQLDVFECPIRLYNGLLHNNMTKIGLNMSQVKLPKMQLDTIMKNPAKYTYDLNNSQIASDSLLNYLGIKGVGDAMFHGVGKDETMALSRRANAVPMLAYWDIYKNYYANKQEEKGVVISANPTSVHVMIESFGYNRTVIPHHVEYDGYYHFVDDEAVETWTSIYMKSAEESTLPVGVSIGTDTYQEVNPTERQFEWHLRSDARYKINFTGEQNIYGMEIVLEDDGGSDDAYDVTLVFPNAGIEGNTYVLGEPKEDYIGYKILGLAYDDTMDYAKNPIVLEAFDLDNIDKARIEILKNTGLNNELIVNTDIAWEPYSISLDTDSEGYIMSKFPQVGLGIKTYQSDLLQNWLQTEWIDGVNGINNITAIDVSSGTFTIDALNLANKVYNMLNRVAVSGGSYEDYIEAVYTVDVTRRAESPVYKGGMSSEIMFEEVVSTAATGGDPLGTLAGKGGNHNKKGGHLEIRCDEPGYIIGIVSITPRIDYSQGNDWDMFELDTLDDLHKPALDGIGFEDLLQERMAWWGTQYDDVNEKWIKYAAGKTPAWMNYMTALNETHGDFAVQDKTMFMTLNRRYEYHSGVETGIADLTTYIDPRKYNYCFADTSINAQNFWVQIGVRAEARRVMSAKILPSL